MGRMPTPLSLFRKAQDSLEQSLSAASHEEVHLRQSRFWASTITWALMGTTAFAIGWLAVAKTEEIVVATGKLEPLGLVNEIQMPVGGVAEDILVKAGDHVKAGQVLMRLDTDATLDRRRTLVQGISLKSTELDLKHSELKRYLQVNDTEQAVLARNLALNQEMMQRFDALAKQGAAAELQYLQQKNRVEEIRGQIEQSQVERLRQVAILNQGVQQLRGDVGRLRNELNEVNVNIRYQKITSPVDGVVFDLKPTSRGFVAQTSEPIMKIVPFDSLIARVEVPSNQIGFVSVGKEADISIDSFPATDFGVIPGTVVKIGSDALPPDQINNTYRFPADVQLKTQQLRLKSGQTLPLQAGMSLTANIKLRKVTYLQMLLGGFRDKADALRRL